MGEPVPVIPPEDFMVRLNASRAPAPPLTALDPIAMAVWAIAAEGLREPGPLLIVMGV